MIAGHLVVGHVPYVTHDGTAEYGRLISTLNLADDVTQIPDTHVVYFDGMEPCDRNGRGLDKLINQIGPFNLGSGLTPSFSFSHKPAGGYPDYYEKMSTYVHILFAEARMVDPNVTPLTYPVLEPIEDDSPFLYEETASAHAGIGAATDRLRLRRIAIVGVGGTGSHVLDLVAKTPVAEIHLFDGDRFLTHNAFRAPGATSAADLRGGPQKAEHFAAVYATMRKRATLVPHPYYVDEGRLGELDGMDAVFLCIDGSPAKRAIVEHLEASNIPFYDTGIGAWLKDTSIGGTLRVTAGVPGKPVSHRGLISLADGEPDIYADNIQVGDLNALNAALAVIRWKRELGFYLDLEHEQQMLYTIDGNTIDNEAAE